MGTMARSVFAGSALCAALVVITGAEAGPPAQLVVSRFVALGYDFGAGFVGEMDKRADDVLPEEREALRQIRDGIEAWGKYKITPRPSQAELLIAVRKGRLLELGAGGRAGQPGSAAAARSRVGSQASSPEDMLEVFDAKSGTLLWRGMRSDGLVGSGPPLYDSFRAEVEKAERSAGKP